MKKDEIMKLIIILTLVALFFDTPTFSAEPGLTDKESKAFIENLWSTSAFAIKLGSMTVVGGFAELAGDINTAKNEISGEHYKILQAYEKVGIIKISASKTEVWLGRQITKIFVTKTDAGEELVKKGGLPQKDGWLIMRQGIFRVDEIIKNEARRKGIDDYRIIMANYTAEWTPECIRALEMVGRKLSEKRKVIMLIKFDPFSSTWKHAGSDLANRDENFSTNYVSTVLGEYK